jgi:mRNA-degrading endonuclease YafQ of YafQ-DinJ toxin-antitoxin module
MRILLRKSFEKQFKKLPPAVPAQYYQSVGNFLEDKCNALLNNHSVEAAFPRCRSINVNGDYRVIFCEESEDVVVFLKIGTHAQLY